MSRNFYYAQWFKEVLAAERLWNSKNLRFEEASEPVRPAKGFNLPILEILLNILNSLIES